MKDWFMNIDEVQLITFSPTCTSKQVGEAIVHGTGISSVSKVDLTLEAAGKREVPSHALAVITVPVYGGHVAPLALERMKELHADGAPAVVVVVYGNRAYEKALVELDAFVTKLGFKVIAGATFVGEHSYSSEKYPVAAGRPDADDLEYAKLFGEKIRAKIAAAEDMEKLYGVDVTRIQRPRQPFFPLLRFLRRVVKLRKSGVPMPRTPQVDAQHLMHFSATVLHSSPFIMAPAGPVSYTHLSQTNLFNEQFADEYDTILMLMNGSGIIGKLENLPDFFRKMKLLLRPGGCVLMDSSNLSYLFEEEDGSIVINLAGDYYGEVDFQMQYKNVKGDSFDWLYIDFQTLSIYAAENGFKAELVKEGTHYDYLAKLSRQA